MRYDEDSVMDEDEPRAMPEVWLAETGPCCVCSKADQRHGCFHCGRPVCMDAGDYMNDSTCGGWIMDWWTSGAMDPDDGNEFLYKACLEAEYGKPEAGWSGSR